MCNCFTLEEDGSSKVPRKDGPAPQHRCAPSRNVNTNHEISRNRFAPREKKSAAGVRGDLLGIASLEEQEDRATRAAEVAGLDVCKHAFWLGRVRQPGRGKDAERGGAVPSWMSRRYAHAMHDDNKRVRICSHERAPDGRAGWDTPPSRAREIWSCSRAPFAPAHSRTGLQIQLSV